MVWILLPFVQHFRGSTHLDIVCLGVFARSASWALSGLGRLANGVRVDTAGRGNGAPLSNPSGTSRMQEELQALIVAERTIIAGSAATISAIRRSPIDFFYNERAHGTAPVLEVRLNPGHGKRFCRGLPTAS